MSDQPDIINQSPPRPEGGTSIPGINTIGSSGDPNVPKVDANVSEVDATLSAEVRAFGISNNTVSGSNPAETPSTQPTQPTQGTEDTQVIDSSDRAQAGVIEGKIISQLQAIPTN